MAVLVLSHRGPAQVARLVSRLATGSNTVAAIHHDPNGEPLALRPSSSLVLIPNPVPCPWGRLSRAVAIRNSLAWLRANIPELSWVLVISGQDYPIRTMASIEAELDAASCDAFLRHFRLDSDPAADVHPWQTITRQRYLYRRRLPGSARSFPLPWRRRYPFPGGEGLYAGSHWCNLSARAVDKAVDSPLNDPLLRFLRRAPLPDEAWTATAVIAGKPDLAVVNDRRRYIRWPPRSRHPAVLTPADLPAMRESNAFFARKIDLARWPEACDALDSLAESRN
jgi:core-2/I-Branching enzyme